MPDITMCEGEGCDRKKQCYRHTATPSEYRQSYFVESPVDIHGECDHFWTNKKLLQVFGPTV